MDFSEQVVLVTGGSRGIGKAVSQAFADRGAYIAVNYRSNDHVARDVITRLSGSGHRTYQADVADYDQCQSLISAVIKDFGRLDVLVNNAGIHEEHPIESVTYPEWERIFNETLEVNLLGPARLMFLAARHMMENGGGRIVNISSRGAFRGEPDQPAYGASKAGLNALSQSLAKKLAPWGVFIGVVAPGFTETEMVADILAGPRGEDIRAQSPLDRVARPKEVAYATIFMASKGAEFSTGTIIDVNGASYLRS